MSIVLVGATSGSVTLQEPAVAGTTVLDLPATSGTVALTSQIASFDAGTILIFGQTSAPTGWTKLTNLDNYALRVVSGAASTGGTVAFTTAFASQAVSGSVGSTTLSTSEIPSHTHTVPIRGPGCYAQSAATTGFDNNSAFLNSGSTGGGGSHTHSFSSTAINLAVQYVDVIRASKN